MRALWAVFWREVVDLRMVLLASGLLALVPWLTPLFGRLARDPDQTRVATAAILSAGFGLAMALLLSSTTLSAPLTQGKLSFFFSRPIPAWALWAGKMLAAAFVAVAAAATIALPSQAAPEGWRLLAGLRGTCVGILLLVPLGHWIGVTLRARSPWLLLDLGAITLSALAVRAALARLTPTRADALIVVGLVALVLFLWVASLVTSFVQVLWGRTDLAKSHRLVSVGTAIALALGVGTFDRWSRWSVDLSAETLSSAYSYFQPPVGPWVFLEGAHRNRPGVRASVVLNAFTGESARVSLHPLRWPLWLDEKTLLWFERESLVPRDPWLVTWLDLTTSPPKRHDTQIAFHDQPETMFVTEQRKLAIVYWRANPGDLSRLQLATHDLRNGKLMQTVALESVATRRSSRWTVGETGDYIEFRQSPGGQVADTVWSVHKETGEIAERESDSTADSTKGASFFWPPKVFRPGPPKSFRKVPSRSWSGPIACGHRVHLRRGSLSILVKGESAFQEVPVSAPAVYVRGAPSCESLLLAVGPLRRGPKPTQKSSWLLDLKSLHTKHLGDRLFPISQPGSLLAPDSPWLFATPRGGLLRIDPVTGKRHSLVEGNLDRDWLTTDTRFEEVSTRWSTDIALGMHRGSF